MPEIKPLKMMKIYLVSPGSLNGRACNVLSSYMDIVDRINGTERGYTERQALCRLMGRSEPPDNINWRWILDTLCECATDKDSELYSPDYMSFMRWVYPTKGRIAYRLAEYCVENELEGINNPQEIIKFMKRHGVHDRGSRTITVPLDCTKPSLIKKTKVAFMDNREYEELIAMYERAQR